MTLEFLLLLVCAYLFGAVPSAYLVVRWSRGVDIRQYGSGNVGVSNLLKLTSKWLAIPVVIFDVGKGMGMVWLSRQLGMDIVQQVAIGLGTIVGHAWPVYLGFKGGRSVLTILGVVVILAPPLGLLALVANLLFAPFRQMSLGTILVLTSLPIISWFLGKPLGIEERLPITLGLVAILFLTVFRRLTAPRTPVSATVGTEELLVNRLLFDRDIKDRETWIHQTPRQAISLDKPQPRPLKKE